MRDAPVLVSAPAHGASGAFPCPKRWNKRSSPVWRKIAPSVRQRLEISPLCSNVQVAPGLLTKQMPGGDGTSAGNIRRCNALRRQVNPNPVVRDYRICWSPADSRSRSPRSTERKSSNRAKHPNPSFVRPSHCPPTTLVKPTRLAAVAGRAATFLGVQG